MKDSDKKQKKLIKNLEIWTLALTFVLIVLFSIVFADQIESVGQLTVKRFGLPGLFGAVVLMDFIAQPIPPDFLVYSYILSDPHIFRITFITGMASVLAGAIGYFVGRGLKEGGIDKWIGRKKYNRAHYLFTNYGFWAVLIGALTPVPFSVICWSAGIFKMPFRYFLVSVIVTRVPRFMIVGYVGWLVI